MKWKLRKNSTKVDFRLQYKSTAKICGNQEKASYWLFSHVGCGYQDICHGNVIREKFPLISYLMNHYAA